MKAKVLDFLQKAVEQEHIPGAVIHVTHKGETILEEAIGNRSLDPTESPMKLDTVFDLASLTKVVGTLPVILMLMDDGSIRLDDPVAFFLPEFAQEGKEAITIRNLLTHTSGLPAHKEFYKESLTTEQIVASICSEKLAFPVGSKVLYSDLGLITLYQIIEAVTEKNMEDVLQAKIFHPLEMYETGFNPTFARERYAPTEYSEVLGDYKYGIVHDENTESMGGISGHAGLFSTVADLRNYLSMIENDGIYKGKRILSSAAIQLSRQNDSPFDREYRGLGWMLKSPALSSCGDLFSEESYGHTGFTGTSIWVDPSIDLSVILLTNRVFYGRKPHMIRLRPRLHNIIRAYF